MLYYDFGFGEEDPADVLLYVGVAAAAPIPNLASFTHVLGPAGNTTWILPQTQNSGLLWLGVGNESLSTTDFVGNQYLTLLAVEGPGHFALFFNAPLPMIQPEDLAGGEWAAWYRLTPAQRWLEKLNLLMAALHSGQLGGALMTWLSVNVVIDHWCILRYNTSMLLRETLGKVLATPAAIRAPDGEVPRLLLHSLRRPAGHALVLTGVRRCGKSTLQQQLWRRERGPVVFCNLEDTRLYGMGPDDFPALLSVLDDRHAGAAVFLDEVQEVSEWPRLVRALLDAGRRVCVTGSNASLLGRELGAKLTGRHVSAEVYPFSYAEYLAFCGGERGAATLDKYLAEGGFPGALREGEAGPGLLRELLRDVVQRDIVSRYALRDSRHLMNLSLHLMAHTGQPLSLQALAKGLAIPSVAQTSRYVEYLQDAWLLLAVPKFSASFKQRVVSPPKYYAIDPGFRTANTPNPTPDAGRRLENAVLLALRRRGTVPAFAAEAHQWECDFLTPETAIQVCAELTPQNRDRELRGLLAAGGLPGARSRKRELLVLTLNQRDALKEEGRSIAVLPAWEWLD